MSAIFRTEDGARGVAEAYRNMLDHWPVPHAELRILTRQGQTFVIACGPADAPPLVLFHGAQANAAAWMFDAMPWSRHSRVYAVDVIGDAGFSAAARPPLATDAHALWLDDVFAGLGVERARVVGVSLGGWLALDYAIRRPGRVEKVALMCPAGVGAQKNFLLRAAPLLLLGPWGLRKVREMVFGPSTADLPPLVQRFAAFMGLVGRHTRPRRIRIPIFSDASLSGLQMPVLAIVGGRDVLLDSDGTRRRLERLVPLAEVHFLPEAHHFIRGQGQVILDFLQAAS